MIGRPRDAGRAKRLRPAPCSDAPRRVPDSKVGQFLALLERSEVPGFLDELSRGRPGPSGIRPRTVLVGLMLAAHYTGRATVADAWWILDFCLGPRPANGWDCPSTHRTTPTRGSRRAAGSTGPWTASPPRAPRAPATVRDPASRPTAALDLSDRRQRAAHPAARPTVVLPESESARPPAIEGLPTICRQTTMTVHADAAIPKYRQDFPYLSPTWDATYKPIRSHNEGMNGQLKGVRIDIGNKKHRPVRGRVAQHLLVAILLMIANLDTLGRWLDRNTDPTDLDHHHHDDAMNTGRPDWALLVDGRPPPHID